MDKIVYFFRQGFPCLFHLLTGFYCPGCGGTRAVKYLLQGRVLKSIRYHPLVVYVIAVACLESVSFMLSRKLNKPEIYIERYEVFTYIGIGIIIVNFLIKNLLLAVWGIDLLQ